VRTPLRFICPAALVTSFSVCRNGISGLNLALVGPVVIGLLFSFVCYGQTAHFVGSQITLPAVGLNNPRGVAVDSSGNVYIADTNNNRIVKETLSGGSYAQSSIGNGLQGPYGVAVDASGNVYIADSNNHRVLKETLSNGTYTQSTIGSGLVYPEGVAVDEAGNVYIADSSIGQVLKETLSGGSYSQSSLGSGISAPDAVSVDQNGNVYIVGASSNEVFKEVPAGGNYLQSTIGYGLSDPTGIAVDGNGNLYVAVFNSSTEVSQIFKETLSSGSYTQSIIGSSAYYFPLGIAVDGSDDVYIASSGGVLEEKQAGGNFGTINVGSPSSIISLIFTFDSAGAIGAPTVVTQGATGLDFADAGTGTCTTLSTSFPYTAGESCTVNVIFTPRAPGLRFGAAELEDNSGNLLAYGYAAGTGIGPAVTFPPGVQSILSLSDVVDPENVAVDAAGNLYIVETDYGNSAILKETWTGSGYTRSVVTTTGIILPAWVAVDGAGSIYIADEDAHEVLKETPTAGSYLQSVPFPNMSNVEAVAVDITGNVYIASDAAGLVKETLLGASSGYSQSTIASSVFASGIAVDGAGGLYAVDRLNNRVLKETPSADGYIQSILVNDLDNPKGIALDDGGNVYITEEIENGQVLKETPTSDGYTQSTIASGLLLPSSVAVDGRGNIFISSQPANLVWKIDFVDAPGLNFAPSPFGLTSSDSPQTVTLENFGNAALSFPAPTSGNNPSIAASFTLNNGASACPSVGSNSTSAGTLAAGASCQLPINFTPQSAGAIVGSLEITDNALNAGAPNYASQSIALSGTGTQATAKLSWATPAAITYGMNLSGVLNATAQSGSTSIPGTFVYTATPSGGTAAAVTVASVLETGNYTLNVAFTPANASDSTSATGSISLTVSKATPQLSLTSSANPAFLASVVTLTANVASSVGTPTGTVSFYDGTTLLGTVTAASGVATYATSALIAGANSITAVYSGDGNFATSTSAAMNENIQDFSIALSSGGASSVTVASGTDASYSLVVAPLDGSTLPGTVSLAASGLPTGATATFSPTSAPSGSGSTNVTLTVATPSQSALIQPANRHSREPWNGRSLPLALGLIVLPFSRRLRRASSRFKGAACVLAIGFVALLTSVTGCGGGSSSSTPISPSSQNYTLTITATAGALSHSAIVTLTVQ